MRKWLEKIAAMNMPCISKNKRLRLELSEETNHYRNIVLQVVCLFQVQYHVDASILN